MNELLTHATKAIGFRFTKAVAGMPEEFGHYRLNPHTRTPNQIITHLFDLASKTIMMIEEGHFKSPPPEELSFNGEVGRYLEKLVSLRQVLQTRELPIDLSKKLFQGPILDMTSHVGQLALLRGMSGDPVPRISYFAADLESE